MDRPYTAFDAIRDYRLGLVQSSKDLSRVLDKIFETGFRALIEMAWDMGAEPYWGA